MRKSPLRLAYETLHEIKRLYKEFNCDSSAMVKYMRNEVHKLESGTDPLETPICKGWRFHCSDDGNYAYDYRVYPDNGESEEEIRKMAEYEVGYGKINSPYDCTGKPFDIYFGVSRVPMGFAVVHCWSVDI